MTGPGRQADNAGKPIVAAAAAGAAAIVGPSVPSSERKPFSRRFAAILMMGALLSKLLGFAREVVMAQVLGASLVADSFRGAITVIFIPLAFLQHEGMPAILIPMYQEARRRGDAAQSLAAITIALTLVALALMLGIQAVGEWWVNIVVGGFVAEGRALTLEFVRIMALGMPAATMLNCLAAGDVALGRGRLTNIRASLLNIAMLIGIALLVWTGSFSALAWAFTAAFNGLAIYATWYLWRDGHLSLSGVTPKMVLVKGGEFLRRLRPLLVLPFAEQGHIWVERALASRLATGAVASLDYARTLTESTLPLICQPVGLAVLAANPARDARAQIEAIVLPVLTVALPACVFLFIFAPDVVRLVFFRGAFTEEGVLMTSHALRGISVGLWAATLGWILLRVLNSSGRNVLAAIILVSAFSVNIGINLVSYNLATNSETGLLFLGLGESARGCVLLAGIVLALECRGRILFLILLGMIPAAAMAVLGWQIAELITGTIPRLLAGGLACAACIALAAAILMPDYCRAGIARFRGRLSGGKEI